MPRESVLNLILLEIISEPVGYNGLPERDPMFPKDVQDEIKKRWFEEPITNDWGYIFEPIQDDKKRRQLIELFDAIQNN